jgi:hypothetical protein
MHQEDEGAASAGGSEELKERAAELVHEARERVRGAADAAGDALDEARATAQGLVDEHGPGVAGALRSATAFLDERTDGTSAPLTEVVDGLAREAVERLGTGGAPGDAGVGPAAGSEVPDAG